MTAQFESRNPTKYNGFERRKLHRRKDNERRQEIRFDLDATNRRVKPGRRSTDRSAWHANAI